MEGGGRGEEEGGGGVRLGEEGVGGDGEMGKVGGQGRIGVLRQGPHQGPLLLHALLDGPRQVGVGELSAWRHGDLTAIRSLWLKTSPQ